MGSRCGRKRHAVRAGAAGAGCRGPGRPTGAAASTAADSTHKSRLRVNEHLVWQILSQAATRRATVSPRAWHDSNLWFFQCSQISRRSSHACVRISANLRLSGNNLKSHEFATAKVKKCESRKLLEPFQRDSSDRFIVHHASKPARRSRRSGSSRPCWSLPRDATRGLRCFTTRCDSFATRRCRSWPPIRRRSRDSAACGSPAPPTPSRGTPGSPARASGATKAAVFIPNAAGCAKSEGEIRIGWTDEKAFQRSRGRNFCIGYPTRQISIKKTSQ